MGLIVFKYLMFRNYFLERLLRLEIIGMLVFIWVLIRGARFDGASYFMVLLVVLIVGEAALGLGLLVKVRLTHGAHRYREVGDCVC